MRIDRTRFLLLTTTLAATAATALAASMTACTVNNNSIDGGATPQNDSGSSTSDAGDGSAAMDGGAAACLDDEGTLPACSAGGTESDAGDAGDAGPAPAAKCEFECTNASGIFKRQVAKAINDCLELAVTNPADETACSDETPDCVAAAVDRACEDSSAASFCTEVLAGCTDAAEGDAGADAGDAGASGSLQARCVAVASALTAAGRDALAGCAAEGLECGGCITSARAGALFAP